LSRKSRHCLARELHLPFYEPTVFVIAVIVQAEVVACISVSFAFDVLLTPVAPLLRLNPRQRQCPNDTALAISPGRHFPQDIGASNQSAIAHAATTAAMVKIMITKIILASKTICNYGRAKLLKTIANII
jgi:hypothetical protein